MKFFNEKAKVEFINHLRATKNKIDVKPGKCRYNHRCQYNSVHEAINKNQDKIAMCVYIHGDYPIIHFINVDKNGKFTDNTLGNWSDNYEFFFVKYIDKVDYFNVDNVFDNYRDESKKQLKLITRWFSNISF